MKLSYRPFIKLFFIKQKINNDRGNLYPTHTGFLVIFF